MEKIDLKNKRILSLLDMDARMPINELAKKAKVSRQVATYRIERMKKEQIILGEVAVFDSVVVGYYWYRVLLRLNGDGAAKKTEILGFLSSHPSSIWVGEVGGDWDIVVNFMAKDNYEFNIIFEEALARYGKNIGAYETLIYVNVRDQQRAYILEKNDEEPKYFNHEMKYNQDIKLDLVDLEIIKIISRDSSVSNWQIAQRIGISDKTVTARLKQLERNNLLLGYRLLIHASALGYEAYMVFLGINNLQPSREKTLEEFFKINPNITYVVKHFGKWRIGLEIEVTNREEFQEFLVTLRTKFGDIISDFETFPIFKDHKVNYFPLPEQNVVEPLSYQ